MLLFKTKSGRRAPRLLCGGAALLCALGTSGCGVANGPTATAQLRIVDASATNGAYDIFAGTSAIAYNLSFGTVTSYVPATPDAYALSANAAGTTHALTTVKASLAAGKHYTMLIHSAPAPPQVLMDQSQPASPGNVALRFLNESQSAGALDLYLVPPAAMLATTSALPTGQGVASGASTGYLNVAAGTYTLYALPHGADVSATTVPLYKGASTVYAGGGASTVVILDAQLATTPAITVTTLSDYTPVVLQ